MKKNSFFIILLILITVVLNNFNYLLYPYYKLKDFLFSSVHALNDKEIILSDTFKDSIIEGLKHDNEELLKINKLTNSLNNFNYVNATIIERNREYWFNSITINKGSNDGINIDMAVIDGNGLIGRVSSVTEKTATIKLITTNDTKNKVSAVIYNDHEKIYGLINGYKDGLLNLVIVTNNEIKKDSKVETTGMGGVFPSNILIGKVLDVIKDEDNITTIVRVIPEANIEGGRYVMVLQRKEISNN